MIALSRAGMLTMSLADFNRLRPGEAREIMTRAQKAQLDEDENKGKLTKAYVDAIVALLENLNKNVVTLNDNFVRSSGRG